MTTEQTQQPDKTDQVKRDELALEKQRPSVNESNIKCYELNIAAETQADKEVIQARMILDSCTEALANKLNATQARMILESCTETLATKLNAQVVVHNRNVRAKLSILKNAVEYPEDEHLFNIVRIV